MLNIDRSNSNLISKRYLGYRRVLDITGALETMLTVPFNQFPNKIYF